MYLTVGTAVLVAMLAFCISLIDLPLALYFRSIKDTSPVEWAGAVTDAGLGQWFLGGAAIVYVAALLTKRAEMAGRAAFVFAAVALSGIIVNLLKVVAGRTRPKLLFTEDHHGFDPFRFGHDFASFPSGHATTLAAASVAIAVLSPQWRVPILVLGLLLAFTRVMVTAHFLSDVLAGLVLGGLSTWMIYLRMRRKWGS